MELTSAPPVAALPLLLLLALVTRMLLAPNAPTALGPVALSRPAWMVAPAGPRLAMAVRSDTVARLFLLPDFCMRMPSAMHMHAVSMLPMEELSLRRCGSSVRKPTKITVSAHVVKHTVSANASMFLRIKADKAESREAAANNDNGGTVGDDAAFVKVGVAENKGDPSVGEEGRTAMAAAASSCGEGDEGSQADAEEDAPFTAPGGDAADEEGEATDPQGFRAMSL